MVLILQCRYISTKKQVKENMGFVSIQGRDIFEEKSIQLCSNLMSPTRVQIKTLLVLQMSCQVKFLGVKPF